MGCNTSKDDRTEQKSNPDEGFPVLASETPFTLNEIHSLYELFRKLSGSVVKDGYIHKEEFQLALFKDSKRKNLFLDRMFDLFDVNRDGHIEFEEFVRSLAVFHPKTPQPEKIKYAFRLYDLRRTGCIERVELKEMVMALLSESELTLANDAVDAIVDRVAEPAEVSYGFKIQKMQTLNMANLIVAELLCRHLVKQIRIRMVRSMKRNGKIMWKRTLPY